MGDARREAYRILLAVEEEGAYANLALAQSLRQGSLTGPDRGFLNELVLGVLRRRNALDWAINRMLERGGKVDKKVRPILRLGAYQLLYLEKVPAAAAIHEAVELAKEKAPHHKGFVNGVLRSLERKKAELPWPGFAQNPEEYLTVVESHPRWLVKRWLKAHGPQGAKALCEANNRRTPLHLRTNTLKTDRESLLQKLQEEGLECEPAPLVPEGITLLGGGVERSQAFQAGLCTVQDLSSQLAAHVVAPRPGELVVDACSAPGGKTTHLAQLMKDQGAIRAFDLHPHKIRLIEDNCRRLGLTIVRGEAADARRLPEELVGKADRLLVDAPCSGLGVIGRKPDLRWRAALENISALARLQKEILEGAAPLVKAGGVLVYSTCTTEPEENFDQVKGFLARHPEFTGEDLTPYLPFVLTREADRKQAAKGYLQLWPHIHGTDGFFVARMRRKS